MGNSGLQAHSLPDAQFFRLFNMWMCKWHSSPNWFDQFIHCNHRFPASLTCWTKCLPQMGVSTCVDTRGWCHTQVNVRETEMHVGKLWLCGSSITLLQCLLYQNSTITDILRSTTHTSWSPFYRWPYRSLENLGDVPLLTELVNGQGG